MSVLERPGRSRELRLAARTPDEAWADWRGRPGHTVLRSPRAEARARRRSRPQAEVRPVFVDDSGRRHRMARAAGAAIAALTIAYVAIVASTFSGVPGLGTFVLPGLGDLARPAEADQANVGVDPVVVPVRSAEADSSSERADEVPATSSTTGPPTSTTTSTSTTLPGRGSTTTTPSPSSSVPSRHGSGGPPITPPGQT